MSNNSIRKPEVDLFAQRNQELRDQVLQVEPLILAQRTGCRYQIQKQKEGYFELSYWRKSVSLSYPELRVFDTNSVNELNSMDQAMILYYFQTADGTPLSEEWISFSELPNGMFYQQAFQGYTGRKLVQCFQNDKEGFERAAEKIGGRSYPLGNAGFRFQILPRISLLVVQWLGDEDFPPSFQILFKANARCYMVSDGYAILGSMLTGKLIKAYHKKN